MSGSHENDKDCRVAFFSIAWRHANEFQIFINRLLG